ncbi:MAG: Uma2 family endonuclease [Deltaproteobacteria bacterium]|nr:Uma2 family endonuclease [Deltaproteobacteria bacterium]
MAAVAQRIEDLKVFEDETQLITLQLRPVIELTDDQFFEFCQLNRDLRIERTTEGELEIMPPAGWKTGERNSEIGMQLRLWAKQDGKGAVTDSSAGFKLPNGATRSPDAAWILYTRLAAMTEEQKGKFLPLCPDFVIELRSPTDSLRVLQAKMREYIDNGVQLGFLIDPQQKQVYVYRPHQPVEILENPETLSGDPLLPGFVLDLREIW